MSDGPASWKPDPTGRHDHRYWDGSTWTDNVSDAGVASSDPFDAVAAADAGAATEVTAAFPVPAASTDVTAAFPAADAEAEATPGPSEATPAGPEPADVTAAFAAAPSGPDAPATPPPYVPGPNDPTGSGGGDDGARKRMLIGGGILAVVVIAVLAFLALGGDDDPSVRAELASRLRDDAGLSGGDAECVADRIVDSVGEDTFAGVDWDADEAPPALEAAVGSAAAEAAESCDVSGSAFGDPGSAENGDLRDSCAEGDFAACDELYYAADFGSDDEEFASSCGGAAEEPQEGSCESTNGGRDSGGAGGLTDGFTDRGDLPENFEEILADTYETSLGLDRDKAECLAGELREAIEGGELEEDEAFAGFMDYLDKCDISLEELGGQ